MNLEIPGYSNYYLNTDNNEVYNKRGHRMSEYINGDDFKDRRWIDLCLKSDDGTFKNVKKHRAVYAAYNPNEDISKLQINHLDENPLNNDISNLQACTGKENNSYGTANARRSTKMKGRPNASVMVAIKATVIETGKVEYYESMTEAARTLGVNLNSIRSAVIGTSKTSVGRVWEHYYGG